MLYLSFGRRPFRHTNYYLRNINLSIQISPSLNSCFLRNLQIILTVNNNFSLAKDSSQKKKIPYICGLRARIECEPFSEHSTHSDRVTNIGYLLSLGASPLPGQILFILQSLSYQSSDFINLPCWLCRSRNLIASLPDSLSRCRFLWLILFAVIFPSWLCGA